MKTILNLKQYVILLVAAFAMTSCLDSDDPDFQVVGTGYIAQVNSSSTSKFFPIVTISANEPMSGGCQVSNGKTNVSLKDIEGYAKQAVQTDVSTQEMLAKDDLTEVTGQYTIKAVNSAGEVAENWFSLSASKEMGALDAKIECGADGKITAYFKLVEAADFYYIFLQKDSYDLTKYGLKYWSETELKKATLESEGLYKDYYKLSLNVSDLLYSSVELAAGRYRVVAAAAITSTSYGNFVVLQEGDYDTYTK